MGYRAGTLFDPSAKPEDMIGQLCRHLEDGSGRGLNIRHRNQRRIVIGRKRLAVFVVALMISTLGPGPGFLLGYWLIHRNSKWLLTITLEPRGSGCLVRWGLRAPIDQHELEARFGTALPGDQLALGLRLLASA